MTNNEQYIEEELYEYNTQKEFKDFLAESYKHRLTIDKIIEVIKEKQEKR